MIRPVDDARHTADRSEVCGVVCATNFAVAALFGGLLAARFIVFITLRWIHRNKQLISEPAFSVGDASSARLGLKILKLEVHLD